MIDDLANTFGVGHRGATKLLYIQSHGQQDIRATPDFLPDCVNCARPKARSG